MHRRQFPSFDAGAAMAVQAAADAAAMEALRVERLLLPAVPAASHRADQQQTATQVRPKHVLAVPPPSPPATAAAHMASLRACGRCRRLRARSRLPVPLARVQGLIALGRQLPGLPQGAGVDQLLSAAREHLRASEPQALPLKQLDVLLADYKQLARASAAVQLRAQLHQFAQQQQQQQQQQQHQSGDDRGQGLLAAAAGVQLRFANASKDNLRLRDVKALHREYCQLLAAAH
jgi:hypothetical protein